MVAKSRKKNRKETNIDYVTALLQESPRFLAYSSISESPFFSEVLESGLERLSNLPKGQGHRQN